MLIVVDDRMRTSDPAIFAVGDVAEHRGEVHGLWPIAVNQAEVAAINALGGGRVYQGSVAVMMLKVVDVELTSIGRFEASSPDEIVIALGDRAEQHYRKRVIDGGKIVGAILLGYPLEAPAVTAAVKEQRDVMRHIPTLRAGNWDVLKRT
jgi:nitrite reductase (NADH) large subunit